MKVLTALEPGAPKDGIQGTYFVIFNADHILPIAIIESFYKTTLTCKRGTLVLGPQFAT